MVAPIREIEGDLESRVEALGLELVNLEWAGSGARPIMRLRVDWTDSKPGAGITVGDCARVSRELERWLDQHPAVPERYVLEVSSPGVERPLKRRRDYERFVGREVRIRRTGGTGGRGTSTFTGILSRVDGDDHGYGVVVDLPDGSEVRVCREEIVGANLVFRWDEEH